MIKIEAHLFTPWEVAVVNEAMNIIYKARQAQMAAMNGNVPPGQVVDEESTAETMAADEAANEARVDQIMQDHPEVIADISPVGVAGRLEPTPEPVTEAAMEAVVKAALDKHGVADVRDVITNITGGKRWKEAGAEAWPAIKTALEEMPEPAVK